MTTPAPSDKFEKFTTVARHALTLSEREATRLNHSQIGTSHMLLGILQIDECRAMALLRELQIDLSALRTEIETRCAPRPYDELNTWRNITAHARRVIEMAIIEARRFGHHYIGTEHLLLGLAQVGSAGVSLASVGLDLERARTLIASVPPPAPSLTPPTPPQSPGSESTD